MKDEKSTPKSAGAKTIIATVNIPPYKELVKKLEDRDVRYGGTLQAELNDIASIMCDLLCKAPDMADTQEQCDEICNACPIYRYLIG